MFGLEELAMSVKISGFPARRLQRALKAVHRLKPGDSAVDHSFFVSLTTGVFVVVARTVQDMICAPILTPVVPNLQQSKYCSTVSTALVPYCQKELYGYNRLLHNLGFVCFTVQYTVVHCWVGTGTELYHICPFLL